MYVCVTFRTGKTGVKVEKKKKREMEFQRYGRMDVISVLVNISLFVFTCMTLRTGGREV